RSRACRHTRRLSRILVRKHTNMRQILSRRASRAVRSASIEALETRRLLALLTIAQENALPGTPESQWDIAGAGDTSLQGFATDMSVNQGQTESFKIKDTTLASYH